MRGGKVTGGCWVWVGGTTRDRDCGGDRDRDRDRDHASPDSSVGRASDF